MLPSVACLSYRGVANPPAHSGTCAQEEIAQLRLGDAVERTPPKPNEATMSPADRLKKPDPFEGTWEVLSINKEGTPFLDRHDVWGYFPPAQRPAAMRGLNFGS